MDISPLSVCYCTWQESDDAECAVHVNKVRQRYAIHMTVKCLVSPE